MTIDLSSQVLFLSTVTLFENSLENVARLLLFLIHVLKGSCPLLGRQYIPFLEALDSLLQYTQENAIKQLLHY